MTLEALENHGTLDSASLAMELRGVEVSVTRAGRGPLTLVSQFDLHVKAGLLICIAGRSGVGKSSLVRVLMGLQQPSRGVVFWKGARVYQMSADERARERRALVGYVDQDANVVGGLTVMDNVLLPAIPLGAVAANVTRARDLLASLEVADVAGQLARHLSGGERQRVALARALLLDPDVVIVDEPTSSLDHRSSHLVTATLRRRADSGAAVVVATHDHAIIDLADRVVSLD